MAGAGHLPRTSIALLAALGAWSLMACEARRPTRRLAGNRYSPVFPAPPSAITPLMGWNSWNKFGCNINEKLTKQIADAMVSSGLFSAGYKFLNLDDCWLSLARDSKGNLQADPSKFPSGMKAMADYAHNKGLYFGLYGDSGMKTCGGRAGSWSYETRDVQTLTSWGVDYLKYDNCAPPAGVSDVTRHSKMGKALESSGRKIIFEVCNWGNGRTATWARSQANADLWRTTSDINATWASFMEKAVKNDQWASYAGPGGWNDPDMLEVGNGMPVNEDRVHFSLWVVIKAPLIVGCDVRSMSKDTKAILTNQEAIAINQDSLGVQGTRIQKLAGFQIWGGPLSNNRKVVAIVNTGASSPSISVNLTSIFNQKQFLKPYTVRDVWKAQTWTAKSATLKATVPYRDVSLLVLTPSS